MWAKASREGTQQTKLMLVENTCYGVQPQMAKNRVAGDLLWGLKILSDLSTWTSARE